MDRPPVMRREVDYFDVQGLVRFGYRDMTEASYALVRVKHAEAARSWLRSAPITSATTLSPTPSTAMQVAFTAPGLQALGVSPAVLGGFSDEFRLGMTEPSRSRRLGDVESNAPGEWAWGGTADVPHLLVMFFAEPGQLGAFIERSTRDAWGDAFDVPHWLHTGNLSQTEPFGFADGISQPTPDWFQERDISSGRMDFSNVVALGEFLLGYRNEYEKYTDRPLLDADATTADLFAAEDAPEKKDLGRNGTYLVVRQLQQDVRAFWHFFSEQAGGDLAAAEKLAAAFVGRTTAGEPLAPIQQEPIPGIGRHPQQVRQNQFTYDKDPAGVRCPIGAHVRRANPRNADYFGRPSGIRRLIADLGFGQGGLGDDLTSPVRLHRILRRGREYGPRLSPADALTPPRPDEPKRGLHFICLNASISRQFEFLQHAWMTSPTFSGLAGENDPLVGSRAAPPGCPAADSFTMPQEGGLPRRVSGLPQFVTVRGGAYFFLPGLRALRYFAGV